MAFCLLQSSEYFQFLLLQGATFPELKKNPSIVMKIINDEEQHFLRTLKRGRTLFQKVLDGLPKDQKLFPGLLLQFRMIGAQCTLQQ